MKLLRSPARGFRSLAGQFLVFQLLVVAIVLIAVAAVSVAQSTREFREVRGARMIAVAENMASTPVVRDRYADPGASKVLAPEVDRAVALSGAGLAEIIDPGGTVRVSSDPSRLGRQVDMGPSRADEGRAWFGDLTIDGVHSLVGEVPILADSGDVVAVASVSERYPSLWELMGASGERLLFYLGLGAALGLLASWLLSRRIKRHTRGLEIAEIAGLADHREALLHSIREGVVAVNNEGDITLLNDSAQDLLGVSDDAVGRPVGSVGLDPAVVDFLLSGEDGRSAGDTVIVTRTRVLALNRRAATSQGQRIGTVTTMRDSTELAALQGQLSSHKSVTDTLRAQTHEFANQLHTISGLVQLGEYDSVRDLVGTLTRRRAEISDAVTQRISDPAVAALLIAKTTLAAESGVSLEIAPESHLAALPPALATDVITLLGNLVDNAVDVSVGSQPARVTIGIEDDEGLMISVADSGPGVPEYLRESIFARGVTSKPDAPGGRGIGLALVRIVTSQYGGTVEVTDGPSGGALSWCGCRRASSPKRPRMRDVLIVDDDFMVAEIHRRFVEQVDGFRASGVARTGTEALAAVQDLQPQLVLLDVYLPDMTGLEVLQQLRSDGNLVGVIMITAARELDTVKGALDGGAADFLIKPFEFPQFKAKLEAFAARADTLESAGGIDQSLVDSLFGRPGGATQALPKGLGVETGRLVLDAVRSAGEVSAAECADLVGISRVSARRYLEHYLSADVLELRLQYGAGRPERRYHLRGV